MHGRFVLEQDVEWRFCRDMQHDRQGDRDLENGYRGLQGELTWLRHHVVFRFGFLLLFEWEPLLARQLVKFALSPLKLAPGLSHLEFESDFFVVVKLFPFAVDPPSGFVPHRVAEEGQAARGMPSEDLDPRGARVFLGGPSSAG